ncbi:dTDP-glucose pyrophosphorylase [Chloroflexi bacterium TSY]|nr:dTDP-glucose pyrophosphorylase [Chloroflexi bacterium TSY]
MNNQSSVRDIDTNKHEVVGIIPVGGYGTRLGVLPCSKELLPIGVHRDSDGLPGPPKVVTQYLLEKMGIAQVKKVYFILRTGKWDIPTYFGDGSQIEMNLAYLMLNLPYGVPYTVDQAYPFVRDSLVVFGFPDILFEPCDAFSVMLAKQFSTHADLVLGLFPSQNPQKQDMVRLNAEGQVAEIIIKPQETDLSYTWIIAVWTPTFTQFLHEYLARLEASYLREQLEERAELHLGHVFQSAIDSDLYVESVCFPEGNCLDIGTPDDLIKAIRQYT